MALPRWNTAAFGCLIRDETTLISLLRTQLSGSLPAPFMSRTADTSAPVEIDFSTEMTTAEFRSWEQWYTYDLHDGSLPFVMFMPWGPDQPAVRCRLVDSWEGQRLDMMRWRVRGRMQIERASLPSWSGGAR